MWSNQLKSAVSGITETASRLKLPLLKSLVNNQEIVLALLLKLVTIISNKYST